MAYAFNNTGYKPPATPDARNFLLEKAQAITPFPPAYKTDISHLPVFDQSKIPDCVENATTIVKIYHDLLNGVLNPLSRRFLAIQTVKKDGFPLDNGTSLENALYVAHNEGICDVAYLNDNHEVDITTFANPAAVTLVATANALKYKIQSYAFLSDKSINGLKNAIYQNGLVIVGAVIDGNWWTAANGTVSWEKADIYPIRPPKSTNPAINPSVSHHAFVLYGYDENGFFLRNSFGTEWADGGNNYIPNAAMNIIYEAATVVDLTPQQIQTVKNTQVEVSQVNQVINTVDPNSPNTPKVMSLLQQVVALIAKIFASAFK